MTDAIDHPAHYNAHPYGVECIDLVERMPFCQGNAIKYLWRAEHKGARQEDLQKALWYVRRASESPCALAMNHYYKELLDRACEGFPEVGDIMRDIAEMRFNRAIAALEMVATTDSP